MLAVLLIAASQHFVLAGALRTDTSKDFGEGMLKVEGSS